MKPVIVLVGRPNVGKSTLFNALTRSRNALVADIPGLTRDRQYGDGRVGGKPYLVVDTGGIVGEPGVSAARDLKDLMHAQTREAMAEADAILFLVDGREGLMAVDRDIATMLRRINVPVYLVVNKAEGMDADIVAADFFALGLGAPIPISAAHGDGMNTLMEHVLDRFAPTSAEEEREQDRPRIAVAGRPNVGKSTLVNALLGEERVVVYDQPGTTRDPIRIPFDREGKEYLLIDTAGVRRRARIDERIEKFSVIKTMQAIDEANVVVLVLDAQQGITEQDATLAGYVLEKGRSIVLVVNKWDGLEASRREWVKRELERKLPFLSFAKPHFISALRGTNLGALFPAIDTAFAAAFREMPTSVLNRVLKKAIEQQAPPITALGRRSKLKFAHQGGRNPPLVIIHGNQVDAVPESYRRYLENTFRKAFKLSGSPVRIEFKSGENPFEKRVRAPKKK